MSIKINKNTAYTSLLVLSICAPYLNSYEITFSVWSLVILLTLLQHYSYVIIKYIVPFAAIFLIGAFSTIGKGYNLYDMLRDMTYFLKPIMGLLAGYQLAKRLKGHTLNVFILTGLLLSLIHLLIIVFTFIAHQNLSIHILREYAGYFSDFEVYVLIILIFRKDLGISLSRKRALLYITIISVSSFLYLSRTNFIQFFVLFVGMLGYYALTKKALTRILGVVAFALVCYGAVVAINPKRNGQGLEAFLYKVKVAPIEPFKTKIDVTDWKDFNDNYRSYENIITVNKVNKYGVASILFGRGYGSELHLGQDVYLDGTWVHSIPKVHNGYMTVYLKAGLLGVLLFLYATLQLFFHKREEDRMKEFLNRLLVSTGVFLLFSNWVFLGLYFVADTKAIIIGALLAYRMYITQTKTIGS